MLSVKDVMTRNVKAVDSRRTIRQAAALMATSRIGSLVVVEDHGPMGIITEGDISKAIARGLNPDRTTVNSAMSKRPVTIEPDERVESAAKLMAKANVKKLPVLDDGKLVGIITQTDIVASTFDLVTSLKELVRVRYRPPDFQP